MPKWLNDAVFYEIYPQTLFRDAGYDVRDYKRIAPRYGTNEDLFRLKRGHEYAAYIFNAVFNEEG